MVGLVEIHQKAIIHFFWEATNKDKVVKLDELSQFVLKNVKENAALNGREQTPELNSKNNEVLVKFP